MESGPDPGQLYPMAGVERVVLLKPLVESELAEVVEFTYYDDPVAPEAFWYRTTRSSGATPPT